MFLALVCKRKTARRVWGRSHILTLQTHLRLLLVYQLYSLPSQADQIEEYRVHNSSQVFFAINSPSHQYFVESAAKAGAPGVQHQLISQGGKHSTYNKLTELRIHTSLWTRFKIVKVWTNHDRAQGFHTGE